VIVVGFVGLAVAGLLAVAFIAETVRADARVQAVDPSATSGFDGWPRGLALAAAAVAAVSGLLLTGGVFG
jgi:hypothetical protein